MLDNHFQLPQPCEKHPYTVQMQLTSGYWANFAYTRYREDAETICVMIVYHMNANARVMGTFDFQPSVLQSFEVERFENE